MSEKPIKSTSLEGLSRFALRKKKRRLRQWLNVKEQQTKQL
ncbi:hypothetical protein [Nostoc linckia]|nr:hypothetical protein [Nostoc linckia]